jgi:signal transduction histidine kinase
VLIKNSCSSLLLGTSMFGAALTDGFAVAVHQLQAAMPLRTLVLWVLMIQLVVLALCTWYAVRLVTRPLARLTTVAEDLGSDMKAKRLTEDGPAELACAARAFNAMQQRIAGYVAERIEILAAVSHDLQTPITRMRLRIELIADEKIQEKFRQDLDAMSALVKEGVTYARTLHGTTEPPRRVDARALLESLISDYEDAGHEVLLEGLIAEPILTRPNALRRILVNLIDNALKFASEVRVRVQMDSGQFVVAILDNGPGISPDQLEAVFKPFYKLEDTECRNPGGSGLGLAIAHQLAKAMDADLSLHNRTEGGLEARLTILMNSRFVSRPFLPPVIAIATRDQGLPPYSRDPRASRPSSCASPCPGGPSL